MKLRVTIAFGLVLSGCSAGPPPQATAPPAPAEVLAPLKLSASDVAAVQAGVRRSLKDPESARFGGMMAGKSADGIITVCLHVNAKNSYGGYTGMKPLLGIFVEGPPKAFIVAPADPNLIQFQDQATYMVCEQKGLKIPAG